MSFLAPIRRLPVDILTMIVVLATRFYPRSPLELMRVCQTWRTAVITMPRVRSHLSLCTWTKTNN
jgi:hypothetical protein